MTWTAWGREQRLSFITLALCLGALPLTALQGWIIYLLAHWAGHDAERLALLGQIAMALAGLLTVIEVALAMVLSIRAVRSTLGKDGFSFDAQSNSDSGPGDKVQAAGAALIDAGADMKGAQ